MNTNAVTYFDQIVQLNDKLLGAPAGVLVFLLCLVVGRVYRVVQLGPLRILPLLVVGAGVFFHVAMTWGQQSIVRAGVLGIIIGFGAWLLQKLVLDPYVWKKFGVKLDGTDAKPAVPHLTSPSVGKPKDSNTPDEPQAPV